jgi:glycosyltransferase involved in cell wall biosynthesis
MVPTFSIVIPAYNEEAYLPATLDAVRRAEEQLGEPVEMIVADNLSTDMTRQVAASFGAKVVMVSTKCISAVRNQGAAQATGNYLVFQDADNRMTPEVLVEIKRQMDTGRYVGGGLVNAWYDRDSLGLRVIHGLVKCAVALTGVSMFLLYTTPAHFRAIGGFDERLLSTEDHNFALRLKAYGKGLGLRYLNLGRGEIILSSRKFDEYGDWAVFRHPAVFMRACFNNRQAAYELWYKPRRESSVASGKPAPLPSRHIQGRE